MKVLLSIKPIFANKIFDGSKKFEFRRVVFKNTTVNKVIVYASAPVSRVIGEFEIEKVIKNDIDILWNQTKEYSGISKDYFDSYFEGKREGYAIKIKKVLLYKNSLDIKEHFDMSPPQSYAYIY
ncbi:MAG: hypothetical protein ACO1O6_01205 [Bacteroidota bacterium]